MDSGDSPDAAPVAAPGACSCDCPCCGPSSAAWRHSLKRKVDQLEAEAAALRSRPGAFSGAGNGRSRDEVVVAARVEIANEAAALREALGSHQHSIQELYTELEEERSASATAASEAMSMILKLQREKAEAQMEARQFKRFAEEKMAHDQQEIVALEDLLFKRDQAVQSLSCEVQAYRHRLLSYGILPNSSGLTEPNTPDAAAAAAAAAAAEFDFPSYDYPPLRCEAGFEDDAGTDVEKYPFGETPKEHLQKLEQRICQLERMPGSGHSGSVSEKGVVGGSPRHLRHLQRPSVDSFGCGSPSFLGRDQQGMEFGRGEEFPATVDRVSDGGGGDDMSDRVYTIDAVHGMPAGDDCMSVSRGGGVENTEIRRLYARLQALEADRESMRQTIISMGTDKAQMVLLREIAQQLCKDKAQEKRVVRKQSFIRRFSIISVFRHVLSFVFRRKKSTRIKYNFGVSGNNVGLLLLLEKTPRMRHWRFLTRTQG